MGRLDEPIAKAGLNPFLTEFGFYHRLEGFGNNSKFFFQKVVCINFDAPFLKGVKQLNLFLYTPPPHHQTESRHFSVAKRRVLLWCMMAADRYTLVYCAGDTLPPDPLDSPLFWLITAACERLPFFCHEVKALRYVMFSQFLTIYVQFHMGWRKYGSIYTPAYHGCITRGQTCSSAWHGGAPQKASLP